jgi:hypothetical protein
METNTVLTLPLLCNKLNATPNKNLNKDKSILAWKKTLVPSFESYINLVMNRLM